MRNRKKNKSINQEDLGRKETKDLIRRIVVFPLLNLFFGFCFVVLPEFHILKLALTAALFICLLAAVYIYWTTKFITYWFFSTVVVYSITILFCLAIFFSWIPEFFGDKSMLAYIISLAGAVWCIRVSYGFWNSGWNEEGLELSIKEGKLDLEKGEFSVINLPQEINPPKEYKTKSKFLAKISAIIVPNAFLLIGLAAIAGSRLGKSSFEYKDFLVALLVYILALLFVFVNMAPFSAFLWIRGWEKKTGRKMTIKYMT